MVCRVYLDKIIKIYTWLSFCLQILLVWLHKIMCIENLMMYTHTLRWEQIHMVHHLGSFLGSEKPLGSGEIDGAKMSLSQGRQLLISLTNPVIMGTQCLVTLIRKEREWSWRLCCQGERERRDWSSVRCGRGLQGVEMQSGSRKGDWRLEAVWRSP